MKVKQVSMAKHREVVKFIMMVLNLFSCIFSMVIGIALHHRPEQADMENIVVLILLVFCICFINILYTHNSEFKGEGL